MKRLLLLRHGEAEPAAPTPDDFERPLTPHGRDQALHAAHRLRQVRCIPGVILASPALRTRETATIVATHLERLPSLHYEASAYPGSPEALLRLIRALPASIAAALIVGHNPGLSTLARQFAADAHRGRSDAEPPELSTGGLCRIELSGWSALEAGIADVTLLI